MTTGTTKHVYIADYHLQKIHNIEIATDEESYFDVNINIGHNGNVITAATYEVNDMPAAQKLANGLSDQYNVEVVEYYGS